MNAIQRLDHQWVAERGWQPGTTLENRAMRVLDRFGFRPCACPGWPFA